MGGETHGDGWASWDHSVLLDTRSILLQGSVSQKIKLSFEASLESLECFTSPPPIPQPFQAPDLFFPHCPKCSSLSPELPIPFSSLAFTWNPLSTFLKSYPLIHPYLFLKLFYSKIELGGRRASQKELSFTFANQIRFKMVRRHERVTVKPLDMQGDSQQLTWFSWIVPFWKQEV